MPAKITVGEAQVSGKKAGGGTLVLFPVELETDESAWAEVQRPIKAFKRFSDFNWLKARLENESAAVLPSLPNKRLLHTKRVLQERQATFQAFMDAVAYNPSLVVSQSLAAFLDAEPFPAQHLHPHTTRHTTHDAGIPSSSAQSEHADGIDPDSGDAGSSSAPSVQTQFTYSDNPLEAELARVQQRDSKRRGATSYRKGALARRDNLHSASHNRSEQTHLLQQLSEPPPLAKQLALHGKNTDATHAHAYKVKPPDNDKRSSDAVQPGAPSTLKVNASEPGAADGYEVSGEGVREAIKAQDTAGVHALLDRGADPNYTDDKGMSLLHIAAMFDNKSIVDSLLNAGASATAVNNQGETPADCAPLVLSAHIRDCARSGATPAGEVQMKREEQERRTQQLYEEERSQSTEHGSFHYNSSADAKQATSSMYSQQQPPGAPTNVGRPADEDDTVSSVVDEFETGVIS